MIVNLLREEQDLMFSQNYACDDCGISIEELTPRDVLVQQPLRRLPDLHGAGHAAARSTPTLIIPDDSLSILDGAHQCQRLELHPLRRHQPDVFRGPVEEVSVLAATRRCRSCRRRCGRSSSTARSGEKLELHYDQPPRQGRFVSGRLRACANNLERRYQRDAVRRQQEGDRGVHGATAPARPAAASRLKPEALAVTVGGKSIYRC